MRQLQEKINYEKTFDCVHCGYCLPACPTYESMQKETHSPRGRINLVKQFAEGKIDIEALQEPIDKCLGCNACAVVCPTNVEYSKILESAKGVLDEQKPKTKKQKIAEKIIFDQVFPSKTWMNMIGQATWLYKKSGLQSLLEKTGLTKWAPLHLGQFEQVLPDLPSPAERKRRQKVAKAIGRSKAKVGFFTGCVMDSIFFKINAKMIDLLTRAGVDVFIPDEQTCCGALHAHSGKLGSSKELAKRNIEAFERENVDFIVNNAGGCGARLIEYEELFEDEPEWRERAKAFVAKVKDISQLLVELDTLVFTKPVHEIVTYQASCHMLNVQRVAEPPLRLLKSIPGIDYREMEGSDRCCGSAGIYNIIQYDESMKILDQKMDAIKPTDAHTIVTTNPGCLLQMKLGIHREGLENRMRAVHLVELLYEAGPERRNPYDY
ncbi:glycolate oxidase iron-sulfur subunit [Melghirimyces thermohalophilus]|uniref:Glycolate oxidase iron-sulfur subunit n=1 Tax=Melghirimyces thermohalophilus TaxID=1236220 RepID=A0A1G6RFJ0_9BACL|nr:glycolate oxidase iron-sulfur subunit [Melghirimyces thermohalophilus]